MILVTGATGLLGGHLIWYLLQENKQLVALKRENSDVQGIKSIFSFYGSNADELFARIIWCNGDVEDIDSLLSAMDGVEYVYHCAAMVDLGKNSRRMLDVNVGGTENMVKAALRKKIKKLCFVSSIAALPNGTGSNPIDELTPMQINERTSLYGESKRQGEKIVNDAIAQGLNSITVNPGVIIGYSKNMTGSGELFKRVKAGLPFYTHGITGYIAVQDVVEAMVLLMESNITNERFVLVGENKSHKNVLYDIADGYGKYRPFVGFGKSLIYISYVLTFLGKLFGFTSLIDSSSARSSIARKCYSNKKFLKAFPEFEFIEIKNEIIKVCHYHR